MTTPATTPENDDWGALSSLPGNPLMWVLILSEVLVFGALLAGFAGLRIFDPASYATGQAALDPLLGGINTLILVTSGLCAAMALHGRPRRWLGAAMGLGVVFLVLKGVEYGDKISAGMGMESSQFATLYYLTTGFHAAHVVMGIILLGIAVWRSTPALLETVTAFWHMVDLIWVLIYPILYLIP